MKFLSLITFLLTISLSAQNLMPQKYRPLAAASGTDEIKIVSGKTWEIVQFDRIHVFPGEKYHISAHLKLENVRQSHLKVEWLGGSRRGFKYDYICTGMDGSRDWFKIEKTLTAPDDAYYAVLRVMAGGSAEQPGITYFSRGEIRSMLSKEKPVLPVSGASVLKPTGSTISIENIRDYVVCYPQKADLQEKYAAEFLAQSLGKIYNFSFTVTPESTAAKYISIGKTHLAKKAGITPVEGKQGFKLEVKDGNLYISGGPRGILYGVLALLEEDLGCRHYAVDMPPLIPGNATNTLTLTPREKTPTFEIRETLYLSTWNPTWAMFNRVMPLSYFRTLPYEMGGGWANTAYFIHTYCKLIPAENFFETHPEYFPLIDGKRFASSQNRGQLCYTAPGIAEEIARHLDKVIREHPHARIYSVSANDNRYKDCECESCQKLIEIDGTPGAQLDLANRVANILAENHPDILISTLAYVESQIPPKHIKPSKNVLIIYAPIHQRANSIAMLLPINEVEDQFGGNYSIGNEITQWREIADNVILWDYADRYDAAPQPFPTFDAQMRGYDYLKGIGVMGVFSEVAHGEISSLGALKAWVFAKKMWDTELPLDALIYEFAGEYYGPGAPAMLEYIDFQRNKWKHWYNKRQKGQSFAFSATDIDHMDELLAQAFSLCEGESDYGKRIEEEQLIMLSFKLSKMPNKRNLEEYRKNLDLAKVILGKRPGLHLGGKSNAETIKNWEANYHNALDGLILPSSSANSVQYKNKSTNLNMSQYLADTDATTGHAIRQIGKNAWGVQWNYRFFIDALDLSKNYVLRIRARGEHKQMPVNSGILFKLYNYSPGIGVTTGNFVAQYPENDDGSYRWYDLGRVKFVTPGVTGYFYNETFLQPEEGVWYDYMELVPEDEYKGTVPVETLPLLEI